MSRTCEECQSGEMFENKRTSLPEEYGFFGKCGTCDEAWRTGIEKNVQDIILRINIAGNFLKPRANRKEQLLLIKKAIDEEIKKTY